MAAPPSYSVDIKIRPELCLSWKRHRLGFQRRILVDLASNPWLAASSLAFTGGITFAPDLSILFSGENLISAKIILGLGFQRTAFGMPEKESTVPCFPMGSHPFPTPRQHHRISHHYSSYRCSGRASYNHVLIEYWKNAYLNSRRRHNNRRVASSRLFRRHDQTL